MSTKFKKAATINITHGPMLKRISEQIQLKSPKGEKLQFLVQNVQHKEKQRESKIQTQLPISSLEEMKRSRKQAIKKMMKKIHLKKKLQKSIKKVYLVMMFISIAQQQTQINQLGNHKIIFKQWLIYPEDLFKKFWDLFMLLLQIYSSLYIPYVVSFVDNYEYYSFNRIVLPILYGIDMILTCRMCYYNKHNHLVENQFLIIKNYIFGWFIIDLIAMVPFPAFQLAKSLRIGRVASIINSSSLNQNKILEILMNLFDLRQATLISMLFFSAIGLHYASCLWALSVELTQEIQLNFIDAIFWAMQTLSTVGYGDWPIYGSLEYLCAIVCILCGGIFNSLVIGNISAIIANQEEETQLNELTSEFKQLFNYTTILPEYQKEMMEYLYLNFKYNQAWSLNQQEWFQILPINYQNKTLLYSTRHELLTISLFKISLSFGLKILRHTKYFSAQSNTFIWLKGDPAEEIYFILQGTIFYKTQYGQELLEIQEGGVFGEQEFFNKRQLIQIQQQRGFYAQTKDECKLLVIRSKSFFEYLKEYPAMMKYLTLLAEHRYNDIWLKINSFNLASEKERINTHKLDLIKSMNKIDVKNDTIPKKSIMYITRSAHTEQVLDQLMEHRKGKLVSLFERFRKVVQMIIFANKAIEKQISTPKITTTLDTKIPLNQNNIKINKVVPLGVLVKIKQKIMEMQNGKKIKLQKQNEFRQIILSLTNKQQINKIALLRPSFISSFKEKKFIQHNPQKELINHLNSIKLIEQNLKSAQWLAAAAQTDLDKELLDVNRILDRINFSSLYKQH